METKRRRALDLLQRAYQAQMAGHLKQATAFAQASLQACPTAEAYTFLGWTCSLEGNLEKAIDLCQTAIATDPEFGNPYSDIGAYLIQLNRTTEAAGWLRKAIQARRYACYYTAYYNLAQIYDFLGEEEQALDAYRLSLRYCPDCALARQAYLALICRTN